MRSCFALLALLLASACSTDSDPPTPPFYDGEGPLYFLSVRVFADEGTMGYILPSTSLKGDLSLSDALERPGGGMVFADPATGIVLIGDAENASLTRFDVSEGRFEAGKTVSFMGLDVEDLWGGVVFVNERQAYLLDRNEPRAIRFDPKTMEIESVLAFEGLEREGFGAAGYGYPIVRDDGIYMPMRWAALDDLIESPEGSALIHIDPSTDEVTVTSDPRCTSLLVSQTTPSGDTWWYSDMNNTYARATFGEEAGPPDCAMKLAADGTTFAEDGYIDLNARAGGPALGLASAGGSDMWLRVLDEDIFTPDPTDQWLIDTTPSWTWSRLDVDSDEQAVPFMPGEHDTIGGVASYTAERTFVSFSNSDYSETRLVELEPDGLVERASVPGLLDMVQQAF
jgi:hypothetical protein